MIAAAMTTHTKRAATYSELAKAHAVVNRELAPDACSRLRSMTMGLQAVRTVLEFAFDESERVFVRGVVEATVTLECQLCMEPMAYPMSLAVDAVLAESEGQAVAWRSDDSGVNIIVVSSAELDPVELVEDELLLHLPTRVCQMSECERRPQLSYGPDGEKQPEETHRPFAALADWKPEK